MPPTGLKIMVVGINRFTHEEEKTIPLQRSVCAPVPRPCERVRALRARRDRQPCEAALKRVEDAARSGDNLMPHIMQAVESYATVGEISDTIRGIFGEYKEAIVIWKCITVHPKKNK